MLLPRTTGKSSCREWTALESACSRVSAGDSVENSVSITSSIRTVSSTAWNSMLRSSSCAATKMNSPTTVNHRLYMPRTKNTMANPWPMVTARRVAGR